MAWKIGYDARMIAHSGIGVRIQNALKFWVPPTPDAELWVFGNPEILSRYDLPANAQIVPYLASVYSLREMWGHSRMQEMDLLDIPHFNVPILYLAKSIVTIHDLIPWVCKEFHSHPAKRLYLRIVLNLIFSKARKIVAVSEFTRDDIHKEFGVPWGDISVVYNGINSALYKPHKKSEVDGFIKKYGLPPQYLLTVGIGKGHKNQEFVFRALLQALESGKEFPPIVLAGTGGKIPDYLAKWVDGLGDHCRIMPRLPDAEMPLLYQGARCLVYPSLYEGFGFPVVEAQSVGCPVLLARASVLPEVSGGNAVFFDPHSEADFLTNLANFLNHNPSQIKTLQDLGRENAKRFDWHTSSKSISAIYQKVLGITDSCS